MKKATLLLIALSVFCTAQAQDLIAAARDSIDRNIYVNGMHRITAEGHNRTEHAIVDAIEWVHDNLNERIDSLHADTVDLSLLVTKDALRDSLALKQGLLGYTPESTANKTTDANGTSNSLFPTQGAVKALVDAQAALKVDKVTGKGLSAEDFTTAEKSKLAGIAPGATANSTDAALRDRSSHSGTQAISTVTGLQTALNSKVDSTVKRNDTVYDWRNGVASYRYKISTGSVSYVANVRDFGAVGDGVTSDRAAFKAAIATGKDVYVPASANGYALDSTVVLLSGQALYGDGANSKIIFQNPYATGYYMVRTVGFNSISNLQFSIGLKPTWISDNPELWPTGGVYINGTANQVHNCWFKTISGAAIMVAGGITVINGCFVDDNVCGVLVKSEYNHIANLSGSNNRRAVFITAGNNTLAGCNFIGGGGLYYRNISNGDHTSVIGCTFNHMSDPAIESHLTGVGLNVIGCNFWDGKLKITESNGLHITGCTIGSGATFELSGTNTACLIDANYISSSVVLPSDPGIRLLNNFGGTPSSPGTNTKYPRSLDQTADLASGTGGVKYVPLVVAGVTYYIKVETSVP